MGLQKNIKTPFGERNAYFRCVMMNINNHGAPNVAIFRAYPSRDYYWAAKATLSLPADLDESTRSEAVNEIAEANGGVRVELEPGQNAYLTEISVNFEGDADTAPYPAAYEALAEQLEIDNEIS